MIAKWAWRRSTEGDLPPVWENKPECEITQNNSRFYYTTVQPQIFKGVNLYRQGKNLVLSWKYNFYIPHNSIVLYIAPN